MINHRLVLPEHLNHYGFLFGGHLLKWVDEYAWIAATLEYPGCTFVTIGMDKVEFKKSVKNGAVLRFEIQPAGRGTTSVRYQVVVFASSISGGKEEAVFSTTVTFVRIDEQGRKKPIEAPTAS